MTAWKSDLGIDPLTSFPPSVLPLGAVSCGTTTPLVNPVTLINTGNQPGHFVVRAAVSAKAAVDAAKGLNQVIGNKAEKMTAKDALERGFLLGKLIP